MCAVQSTHDTLVEQAIECGQRKECDVKRFLEAMIVSALIESQIKLNKTYPDMFSFPDSELKKYWKGQLGEYYRERFETEGYYAKLIGIVSKEKETCE